MLKNKFVQWIIFIAIVLLFYTLGDLLAESHENERQKQSEIYKDLESTNDSIAGIIISLKRSGYWAGSTLICLSGGEKYMGSKVSYNYNNSSKSLLKFIQNGDSIFKPANSDSLYVYRKGKEYYFIFDETINKK